MSSSESWAERFVPRINVHLGCDASPDYALGGASAIRGNGSLSQTRPLGQGLGGRVE
jgi:hypothetical protein